MHHHLLALGVLIVIHFSALTAAAAPESVEQFGRLQIDLPADSGATAVEITAPDASVARIPVFAHQNARFTYDDRGWEDLKADGELIPDTSRRTARTAAGLSRSRPTHRLARTCPGA